MWNRAETIVSAWKTAIRAAVTIVGASRRRTSPRASSNPIAASAESARWLAR